MKFEDLQSKQTVLFEVPEVTCEEPLDMVSELGLKIKSETNRIQSSAGIDSLNNDLEELRRILGLGETSDKTASPLDQVPRPCTPPNLVNTSKYMGTKPL
jgi:regulatory protein SWI5